MTLQLLNISRDGVIQPFRFIPQITGMAEDQISLTAYGSQGAIDINLIGAIAPDPPEALEEAESSAEAPEMGPDDEDLEDALGSLDAMDSEEAPEVDELLDDDELQSDEDQEAASTDALMSDLPTSVTSSGIDAVDGAVLRANETAGFLNPDGSLRSDQAFLVEARIERLPRDELVEVVIRFERRVRRRIYIYRVSSTPTARIGLDDQSRTNSGDRASFRYQVEFSDYVFNTPSPDQIECPDVRDRLEKFSGRKLNRNGELQANDLMSMMDAARSFGSCSSRIDSFVPNELVRVTGVQARTSGSQGTLSIDKLSKGRTGTTKVLVDFDVSLNRRTRLEIVVRSGTAVNAAGRSVEGTSEQFRIERQNRATQRSVEDAEDLGTSTTVVTSTAVATSVTASVGASMAVSVTGTAVTSSAGGVTTGGSIMGAIDLLSAGQRIYLVSQMAVPTMPENFQQFGQSLSWTMLDIKLPWRDNSEEQTIYRLSNSTDDAAEGESDVVIIEREWRYERLVMVLSWSLLLFICLVFLHFTCIAICFTLHLELPNILRLPRLELYFLYWITPAFAGACASLFTGNENQAWLGVCLLFVLPIPFLAWHVYLLMANFFLKRPEKFSVFYEVKKLGRMKSRKFTYTSASSDREESTSLQTPSQPQSRMEKYLLTPLLGPPYHIGEWKTVEGPTNKFVDRFGPAFEDYRHIPGRRRNATFEVSREESRVQRGHFTPLRTSWDRTRIANVIQISGTVLHLCRMIFIACLILGEDDPKDSGQAITLFILSLAYLLVLRLFRPHAERWHLGLVMIDEVMNVLTYCIILYLLNNSNTEKQQLRRNLGFTMLCFEGIGFFLIFLEQSVRSLIVLGSTAKDIRERLKKDPQILKVIINAQLQNPRYLERKYFRRWVKNTLGRGVYPGVLHRDKNAPIEEMFWADPAAAMRSLVRFRFPRRQTTKTENKANTP